MRRRGMARPARPSLVGTAARTAVVVGTASAVSGRMAAGQAARAQQPAPGPSAVPATDVAPAEQVAPATPSPAGLSDAVFEQLKQLAELRDAGVLTDDEFAQQKAKLLA